MARRFLLFVFICSLVLVARGSVADEIKASRKLKWPNPTIKIFLSSSLFSSAGAIKPDSDVRSAVLRALQRWEEPAQIEFQVAYSEINSISPKGPAGDGISVITVAPEPENLLAFNGKNENASGLTRVFYDARGSIMEADVALNPSQLYTTDKTPGTFDLEAVLTHEFGHLLGLGHSPDASSVMVDGVPRNGGFESFNFVRQLSADDKSKIRGVYGFDHSADGCCARIRGRLNTSAEISGPFLIWIQDTQSGALAEVEVTKPNRFYDFGAILRGRYEVVAQSYSPANPASGAVHSGSRYFQSHQNVVLAGPVKPVTFDVRYIGLSGELSRRAVIVNSGNSYRLVLAGPGLGNPELKFGTTSRDITIEAVRAETWTTGNGLAHRAFQLTVSRSVPVGQYSVFAEDPTGARRYLVGGISVN